MSHGNSPRFNNLCSKVARFTGLTSRGDGLMPKKRNHRPRRMGNHGSVGNGISRVRAASNEAPTAHPNGRYQEAFSCRLPTWDSQPASRPSKVQALILIDRPFIENTGSRMDKRKRPPAHMIMLTETRDHALCFGASRRGHQCSALALAQTNLRSPSAPRYNSKRRFALKFNNYLRSALPLRGLSSLTLSQR